MIELYGLSVSATCNSIKVHLLEKKVAFKEIFTAPSQDAEFLKKSPMGKIPFIGVDGRYVFETDVIHRLINANYPGPSFFPEDAFKAALCGEIIANIKLYIEGPIHRLMGAAFYKAPIAKDVIEYSLNESKRGIQMLNQLVKLKAAPILGELTLADFVAAFYLPIASETLQLLKVDDFIGKIPGLQEYVLHMIKTRPHFKKCYQDSSAERPKVSWPALPEPWLGALSDNHSRP